MFFNFFINNIVIDDNLPLAFAFNNILNENCVIFLYDFTLLNFIFQFQYFKHTFLDI